MLLLLLLGYQVILDELEEETQVGLYQLLVDITVTVVALGLRLLLIEHDELVVLLLEKAADLPLVVIQTAGYFVQLLLSEISVGHNGCLFIDTFLG